MKSVARGNQSEKEAMLHFRAVLGYERFYRPRRPGRFFKGQIDVLASEDRSGFDFIAHKPHYPMALVQVKTNAVDYETLRDLVRWNFEFQEVLPFEGEGVGFGKRFARAFLVIVTVAKRKRPELKVYDPDALVRFFEERTRKRAERLKSK